MALTVDWATKTVNVPKSYLTLISGTLYELDTEQFKLDLQGLEASVYGMPNLRIVDHNTSYTVAGVTYARKVEIVNGYQIEFEDGQYSVRLVGSNNNIFDVQNGILVQNQVQVISTNAAGLIVVTSGSGVTEQDKLDIADRVLDELILEHTMEDSLGESLQKVKKTVTGSLGLILGG